jgi:hypothetical protein
MAKTKWTLTNDEAVVTTDDGITETFPMDLIKASDCADMCLYYGLKQKLADATARSADEKLTGAEAVIVMQDVYKRIVEGKWNAEGVARSSLQKDMKEALTEEEYNVVMAAVKKAKDAKVKLTETK